jgi:hypothetical protein
MEYAFFRYFALDPDGFCCLSGWSCDLCRTHWQLLQTKLHGPR